jgi:O-antigen/teichoic acid export membrane protein
MFRNILQSVFTKGLVAIIGFLLLVVSARYLGAGSRGEINILIINIAIIQILNEVYTGYSLLYFIPKYDLKKIFITGIGFTFLACSFGNSLFYVIQKQLPGYGWLSYVISMLVILNTFNCVIILGKEKIALYNFLCLLQPLLHFLGLVFCIFVLENYTLQSYLWPMLCSFLISFPISLFWALKLAAAKVSHFVYEHKPIFMYGLICQLGVLMYFLGNKYSYYFLASKEEVGLYGTASALIESILIIANGISPVLLAKVVNTGNSERNVRMTLTLSKASFAVSCAAVLLLFVLPNELFVLLLGKGFVNVKHYMLFYAPGILIMSFISIINNYFSAVGQLKKVLVCNSFGFIATLFLAPLLTRHMGIKGAAITADISYAVTALAISFVFFKSNKLRTEHLFSVKEDYALLLDLVRQKK